MNLDDDLELSKFLSWVLRHEPSALNLELDGEGWTSVSLLIDAARRRGYELTAAKLREVVEGSDKQRFAFSADGSQIRAQQGHSVDVSLEYLPRTPPEVLFHGTVERFLGSIRSQGLLKGARHHVHLSPDAATASKVGSRRGKPIVLEVDAATMAADGFDFYLTPNGVWLTEHVPHRYIQVPTEGEEAGTL